MVRLSAGERVMAGCRLHCRRATTSWPSPQAVSTAWRSKCPSRRVLRFWVLDCRFSCGDTRADQAHQWPFESVTVHSANKRKTMTKHLTVLITASLATLLALFAPNPIARADIFQWEYINPANPGLGKQQSTT